uniref:Uncharacterized protein n=1 Tax=Vitrella brassicaformis TaxID=1169539 RepID=A0A7S1P0W8_9ALVE|mmetsp:Transcript_21556/g.52830  ORF Transcript_21556/g.52830 Transcript_21556/m.52830 type:complete len:103 (+) Transcript_21556:727-1035(+)
MEPLDCILEDNVRVKPNTVRDVRKQLPEVKSQIVEVQGGGATLCNADGALMYLREVHVNIHGMNPDSCEFVGSNVRALYDVFQEGSRALWYENVEMQPVRIL